MDFSNDGIIDSQTGLMAPINFYESAARLISWADRTEREVSLISISVAALDLDELITLARLLSNELRGGDLLGRLTRAHLGILLLGDLLASRQLIFRLKHLVKTELHLHSLQLHQNESIIDALKRLGV